MEWKWGFRWWDLHKGRIVEPQRTSTLPSKDSQEQQGMNGDVYLCFIFMTQGKPLFLFWIMSYVTIS